MKRKGTRRGDNLTTEHSPCYSSDSSYSKLGPSFTFGEICVQVKKEASLHEKTCVVQTTYKMRPDNNQSMQKDFELKYILEEHSANPHHIIQGSQTIDDSTNKVDESLTSAYAYGQ